MDENVFTDEDEFDWSLHMLQLPLSCSSQLSAAYQVAQRRYVAAKRECGGMGLHRDVTLYQQYCTVLDGQGPQESNHAALIMPAIKHMHPENFKWKCNLTGDKMKSLIESCKEHTDQRTSSSTPSPAKLDDLMTLLKNPGPSRVFNAKQKVDESSITATTAVRGESHPHTAEEPSLPILSNPSNSSNFHSMQDVKRSSDTTYEKQYTFSRMGSGSDSKGNNYNISSRIDQYSETDEQGKYFPEQDQFDHRRNFGAQNTTDRPLHYDDGQRKQTASCSSSINHNFSNKENRATFPPNLPIQRASSEHQAVQRESVCDYQGQYRGRGFSGAPRGAAVGGRGVAGGRGAGGRYPWQRGRGAVAAAPAAAPPPAGNFRTASHQLMLNQARQRGSHQGTSSYNSHGAASGYNGDGGSGGVRPEQYGSGRSLGLRPNSSVSGKFVPPVRRDEDAPAQNYGGEASAQDPEAGPYAELMADPRMKNIEAKMVELIMNEVLDSGLDVGWEDIAGLQQAKDTIQEVVVWPMLRPDIFTGLRGPPKGVLLFGPPGTGKTMIGKAIASQSGATFFSISASCLTSKWVGEGEKMVRALFAVARVQAPSVIFIDEIDSLLCQRSETEHESSRRIKTEFLVQLDGVGAVMERVLVVGATNRPQELDEAARRRLQKRLYIPLPDEQARLQLVSKLLSGQQHTLSPADMSWVAAQTDGYSGADVAAVCSEAAMGPIRGISAADMRHIALHQVRAISLDDFRASVRSVRPSVCAGDLQHYCDWNRQYGIAAALGVTP